MKWRKADEKRPRFRRDGEGDQDQYQQPPLTVFFPHSQGKKKNCNVEKESPFKTDFFPHLFSTRAWRL